MWQANYVLVHVNNGNNKEFLAKTCPALTAYPHLCVLDSRGTVLAEQGTGQLEGDDEEHKLRHLGGRVVAFLKVPARVVAC